MKRYAIALYLLMSGYSFGNEYMGVWEEDKRASIEFNLNHARQTEKVMQLSRCGSAEVEYKKEVIVTKKDNYSCDIDGKQVDVDGYKYEYRYKIVAKNKTEIVIEVFLDDENSIYEVLHFTDRDSYWVYIGGSDGMDELHTRMYFRRVTQ